MNNLQLTRREYFAVLALQGFLSNPEYAGYRKQFVQQSVKIADELIKELDK